MDLTGIKVGGASQRDRNPGKMRETKGALKYGISHLMSAGFIASGVYLILTEGISLFGGGKSNDDSNGSRDRGTDRFRR